MAKMKISFCTFQGGGFDVMVVDADTGQEVILSGKQKLDDDDFKMLDKLAPACVFTTYETTQQ